MDGSNGTGEYITRCKVMRIENDSVILQEERTYYLSGGDFPERRQTAVPIEYFNRSIPDHIQQGREIFSKIAKAFDED